MAKKNDTETKAEADAEKENEAAEGEESKQAPAAKGWLSRKFIMMAVGGVVGVAALGSGGYFFFFHHSASAATVANQVKPPLFLDMPEVLVNLSGGGGDRTQYLKVKIALEVPDEQVSAQIQPLMPRLLDTFQTYLRELRPTDLDGSSGLYRLKEELTRRVDVAIAPNRINAVLFKEIVVQ
jgi:flagellar protein FliL